MAIKYVQLIPTTEDSYPFSSAQRYGVLDGTGYNECEYLLYGTSNVYQTEEDGCITVRFPDAHYVNRLIVRAPELPEKCSGNVVVEIINPTASFDIERMWIQGHRKFLRDGDIYVGITSKPNTLKSLKTFDHDRYEKLSWPNPTRDCPFPYTDEDIAKRGDVIPDQNICYETGLIWDMLRELPALLRSDRPDNPLRDYSVRTIVLTGWSQSACYLIRFLNDFAYRDGLECHFYDGYLLAGAPRFHTAPVNQYEVLSRSVVRIRAVRQPCIVLQTESENGGMGAYIVRRPDGVERDYLCRHYDIAGPSHDTAFTLLDYYQSDPDMRRIGILPQYSGKHKYPNSYPVEILVGAAFRNLFYWIDTGVAPTPCPPIEVDFEGENCKDALGNSIGGLRTCLLDYPTGRYCHWSNTVEAGPRRDTKHSNPLFGHEEPFPADMLKWMYGTLENYRYLVTAHTAEQVAKGYILREDMDTLVDYAVRLAQERGL